MNAIDPILRAASDTEVAQALFMRLIAAALLVASANCSEDPEFEVFASISLQDEDATLEYDGGDVLSWPNSLYRIETLFPSFESGRRPNRCPDSLQFAPGCAAES
jgi:hypothetical protein